MHDIMAFDSQSDTKEHTKHEAKIVKRSVFINFCFCVTTNWHNLRRHLTTNLHFIFFKWLFLVSCASKIIRSQVVFLFLEAQSNKYNDETPSPSFSSLHAILQHSDVLLMLLSNELLPELGFFCAPRVSRSSSAAASDLTAALSVKGFIVNNSTAHLVS